MNVKVRSRVRGAIVGTAIGDSLGMPIEGWSSEKIAETFGTVKSLVNPKPGSFAQQTHKLRRGQWTDDTQLMLAVGESFVSKKSLDYDDIAKRHALCMNDPRGWGKSTLVGVGRIKSGVSWWNSAAIDGAGNGTPMKIAPIGVLLALKRLSVFEARTAIINISRMTHGDLRPAIAGIIQANAVSQAITCGVNGLCGSILSSPFLAEMLENSLDEPHDIFYASLSRALTKAINMVQSGDSLSNIRKEIGAQSFVVESFPLTFAAVLKLCNNPEECLIDLANQGGDADTTCAMAGALIGAAYGLSAFPKRWREPLEGYSRLISMADGLYGLEKPVDGSWQCPRISFGHKPGQSNTQSSIFGGKDGNSP